MTENSAIRDALMMARTAALEAEAQKTIAEAAKAVAETKVAEHQAAYQKAEAQAAVAKARANEIGLERELEKRNRELAQDYYNKVYRFQDGIGSSSVDVCMKTLTEWSRMNPDCDMEIVFCSPGGSVVAGMALYDFIRQLKDQGHYITTRSLGYAASMAGVLLQVGDKRIMSKEAWLLIHEGSGGAIGSMSEVKDTVKWYEKLVERILDIYYERSLEANPDRSPKKQLSRSALKKAFERKDWWLSSEECLEYGFCDEIA